VPDLLAARIPDSVESWQAAYTTLASIALQTVRQLEPSLGDRVLVLGQGLIGLLISGLLRANGVRVMAADVAEPRRPFSHAMGAERVVILGPQTLPEEVRAWTEGYGVDAVILATATPDNTPVRQAVAALRDRGRLVVVGNTKVELFWKEAYEKEIEVRYTRSYGPGRYDPAYEYGGSDYPIGYVRWTEQRNFEACLQLMNRGALNLAALTTRTVPFAKALDVYRDLLAGNTQDIGVVLEYDFRPTTSAHTSLPEKRSGASQASATERPAKKEVRLESPVRVLDVIGAGNFARTMLLPHLQRRVPLGTIVNATALSANHVRTKFGFAKAATSYVELLKGGQNGSAAVLIATRHHLHAPMVQAALAANRHVFVEKPLCLSRAELAQIDAAWAGSSGSVQVGFNRRFAGASVELKRLLAGIPGPKACSFRVCAGQLDPAHWYAQYSESGGRVLGEACHFLDYFCFLFESRPTRVLAQTTWPPSGRLPFADSVSAQVEFADGSSGQLLYSAEGDPGWAKEQCTVFGPGLVAEIIDFQQLVVQRGRRKTVRSFPGKGHAEQMLAWSAFLRAETPHPFPYEQARQSMQLTFAVLESIQQARAIELASVAEGHL
jgi:predicted dehydrogenase/NADPH:quinone reductase-like Zn-dependent oxidoreductase